MTNAIQFIGTQRSGSNLLRVMLNQHPQISAPHPPHILQVMMPLMEMYGDLTADAAFSELVNDVCTLVELNPVNWMVKLDREKIAEGCSNRSLPQVMKSVYAAKANASGKTVWCCKSMASVHYAREIEAAGIHPVYIFMYRDGRDVACSFRKAVVGEKHIYHLAKQWKLEQELSLQLENGESGVRVVPVRYEEFTADPASCLQRICSAAGVEYSPLMLEYADADESRITAASGKMWSNLTKPVMRNNSKKYLNELSYEDLVIFESVAGDTLEKLGYAREIAEEKLRTFSPSEISGFQVLNAKWQAESKELSAEDMSKRKQQDDFIRVLKLKYEEYKKQHALRP